MVDTAATPQRSTIAIRKITHGDFDAVTAVMARAFDDDPLINFIVKQDEKRAERVRKMMHLGLAKMTFPFGETYMGEGLEGATFWNPPDGRPHGILNDLKMMPSFLSICGVSNLPKVISALNLVEKKHPKTPHYYLLAIGVEPSLQGQGIGGQLLAPMTARCDREGVPAYLESSKERNVPLYERNGFKVVEQLNLPKDGPPIWRMWRDPQ